MMLQNKIPHRLDQSGGIYQIRNTLNNKIYVGQTNRFGWRYLGHCKALHLRQLLDSGLQEDYETYGSDKFVFEIVEIEEDAYKRKKKETWYIANWKPEYNFHKRADLNPNMRSTKLLEKIRREFKK